MTANNYINNKIKNDNHSIGNYNLKGLAQESHSSSILKAPIVIKLCFVDESLHNL